MRFEPATDGVEVVHRKRKVLFLDPRPRLDAKQMDLVSAGTEPQPGKSKVRTIHNFEAEHLDVKFAGRVDVVDVDGYVMNSVEFHSALPEPELYCNLRAVANFITQRYPALRFPFYRRFWSASFASVGGAQLTTLAQGWLVFELSGSTLELGYLGAAISLPAIVMTFIGGAVADRFDKRKIIITTSLIYVTLMWLLAALTYLDLVRVWHILAVAAASAVIVGIEWPTRAALYPSLIERDALLSAVALNSFIWQSTRMAMPAIGGLLMAAFDTSLIFALSGFGYLTMFLVVLSLPAARPGSHSGSALDQIKEGIRFILGTALFKWLIALSYSMMLFAMAYIQLMPAFAKLLDAGEVGYGILLSAGGIGAITGTVIVGTLNHTRHMGWIMLSAALASGLALCGFAGAASIGSFTLAITAVVVAAGFNSVFMISSMTVLQMEVPDALRGRVMGIHSITYSLPPLGGLVLGVVANHTGAPVALLLGVTVFCVIVLAVMAFQPHLREIRGPEHVHVVSS